MWREVGESLLVSLLDLDSLNPSSKLTNYSQSSRSSPLAQGRLSCEQSSLSSVQEEQ